MPFASRGGFLHQPPTAAAGRRTGAADTNSAMTWTGEPGETTQTDQAKYGTASYYTSANNLNIYSQNNPGIMNYGTGDFCLEWYMYIDSLSGQSASSDVMANDAYQGFGFRLAQKYNNGSPLSSASPKYINIFARSFADLDYWDISTGSTSESTWQTGKWYFCVLQRKSSNLAFWLDGILKTKYNNGSSGDSFNFASSNASSNIKWGTADNGSRGTSSIYFDEICWSNSWRYDDSGDISTLPSAAFTVDEFTEQLMHMDGADGGTTFTNDEG